MLSHIQVRGNFPDQGLVYIEYFFLDMYIAILLTTLNSYAFSLITLENNRLLHWRDNLLVKLLYWPLLLWSMAVISRAIL
jgi:hypothetical protein